MVAFFTPPPMMKSALVSTFIGITALSQATGTVVWPAGTQAGDLALLIMAGNSWPVPAGWTYIAGDLVGPSSPSASGFAFKVLDAGDISSPPSETVPSNGAYYFAVYRGGTTLTKKSTAASTAATVSVPGFAKAATSRLVLAIGHDRDPGTAPTPPTGFNFRATAASTYFMHGVYDLAAAAYTDNSAVVFNLVSPGNPYAGRGTLLEIT